MNSNDFLAFAIIIYLILFVTHFLKGIESNLTVIIPAVLLAIHFTFFIKVMNILLPITKP